MPTTLPRRKSLFVLGSAVAALCLLAAAAPPREASRASLKPLMTKPSKVVVQEDFSKGDTPDKAVWAARQGTQWTIEKGVLVGKPSTQEYQDKHKDHKGYEPRLAIPPTPKEFAAAFSFRFHGGEVTPVAPFIEFGHHVCRVTLGNGSLAIVADHESQMLTDVVKNFPIDNDRWYHVLAEMKGEEFVIQFAGGPTLYAKCPAFAQSDGGEGASAVGIAGPKGGTVELDNVTIWTIDSDTRPDWKMRKSKFPVVKPVTVKSKDEMEPKKPPK